MADIIEDLNDEVQAYEHDVGNLQTLNKDMRSAMALLGGKLKKADKLSISSFDAILAQFSLSLKPEDYVDPTSSSDPAGLERDATS